jgi:hypothetical protein
MERKLQRASAQVPVPVEELPVVSRLVVEIRSDGTRTVARGGIEDVASGQTVAISVDAATPWELPRRLAGALLRLPQLIWASRKRR